MEQKSSFYNDQEGWGAKPDNASIRLESRLESRISIVFYQKDDGGKWQVVDEGGLNPSQRGLIWQVWKTALGGRAFLAFRGVRPIDSRLAKLLEGIKVYDHQGQESGDVTSLGYEFLLDGSGAKTFYERLAKVGGQAIKASPLSDESRSSLAQAERALSRLGQIIEADSKIVQRAEQNDLSRLSELSATEIEFRSLLTRVEEDAGRAISGAAPLTMPEKSAEERDQGQVIIDKAKGIVDQARMLAEVRQDMIDQVQPTSARTELISNPARLLLARELAKVARQDGLEVETVDEGVRIKLSGKWLYLGDKIELRGQ